MFWATDRNLHNQHLMFVTHWLPLFDAMGARAMREGTVKDTVTQYLAQYSTQRRRSSEQLESWWCGIGRCSLVGMSLYRLGTQLSAPRNRGIGILGYCSPKQHTVLIRYRIYRSERSLSRTAGARRADVIKPSMHQPVDDDQTRAAKKTRKLQ